MPEAAIVVVPYCPALGYVERIEGGAELGLVGDDLEVGGQVGAEMVREQGTDHRDEAGR